MTKYLPVLKKCPLFAGIEESDIEKILPCLSATVRQYEKNAFILTADDSISSVGLILSGSVHVIKEDFWGRKDILSQLGPGELFAEAFSCAQVERMLTISSVSDSGFVNANRVSHARMNGARDR